MDDLTVAVIGLTVCSWSWTAFGDRRPKAAVEPSSEVFHYRLRAPRRIYTVGHERSFEPFSHSGHSVRFTITFTDNLDEPTMNQAVTEHQYVLRILIFQTGNCWASLCGTH